jgi:hypothetical protein
LRWVGIDEAGYGPNLGPLVITAVVAESRTERRWSDEIELQELDFWGDLDVTVDRAGGDPERLWVDDSKAVYHAGRGRDRLELACLAAVNAIGHLHPGSIAELFEALGAGTPAEVELTRWLAGSDGRLHALLYLQRSRLDAVLAQRPLCPRRADWRLTAVRSVIVAPERFNTELAARRVKSSVHFEAFARLLSWIWELSADGTATRAVSDKHGGRHYYLPALCEAFPGAWIDRGTEGAELSRYRLRDGRRAIELILMPGADRSDGLVALASIVSKAVRELWMDVFNAYWRARIPQLRPTAGYPTDALRFRREIEAAARAEKCDPAIWWRDR